MRIINNSPDTYAEVRNITFFQKERIKMVDDIFSTLNKLKHKLTGVGYTQFYKGFFFSSEDQKTPCHFFNSINLGRNPWIVTFETILPRIGNANRYWYNLGIKRLVKENCRCIIALSECAYNRQIAYVKEKYPQYEDVIRKKMIVMHPPQAILVENYQNKQVDKNAIIFTIVGSDFFRKGGREVLNVFNELIPLFPQLKLIIISSLIYGDYASQTSEQDFLKAMQIIKRFPENITHYKSLPNNEVLEILKKSHVGLLPSWGDTYGYSVLEAQAAGCPVITTNLRAFPEINNNNTGWVLEVPLNNGMDADIDTTEKRINFQKIIEKELKKSIVEIIHFPGMIRDKGILCIERIKKEHSQEDYKNKLERIYKDNFKDRIE
ncbi:MAG: glycosyl transferase group 1 [Bacteroidetes bacterium]|jgi:glycosyltransferase involved in cell wall biosynthesis|nr:glycosyl transferase group 1 [Bacteroidota bacterium]